MIELLWNVPVSEAKMDKCIAVLNLRAGQRVLDVGCGCGEVLIRTGEQFQIQGLGVDVSLDHITEAKRRASGRVNESTVLFVQADARSFAVSPESIDLAICIGATHAYGLGSDAYRNAIGQMISVVAPGGLIFVADGYMKQPAAPEYRALLGDTMPDEMTHAANVAVGIELGLVPLAAWTSSEEEWDDFEWSYQRIVERNAESRPTAAKELAKLRQRREWMDAYLKWGRDTLGFGMYLFKRPKE